MKSILILKSKFEREGISKMTNQYDVEMIDTAVIWSDTDFNCRGEIAPMQVMDLCQDIERNGLQFPIAVQPLLDVSDATGAPPAAEYRIVAGHRRFKAYQVLQATHRDDEVNQYIKIPCMLKPGLTDIEARVLNLGENLKRQDLNILQEARAIEKLSIAGVPRDHVAAELGKSSGWVQARYNLLALPEPVQEEAAAGLLTQYQVKQLYSLRNDEEQLFEAVRKIKDAKAKGEKGTYVGKKQKQKTTVKKTRKANEMMEMSELIGNSPIGYGLQTRVLAWASGNITTEALFTDFRQYCDKYNLPAPRLPNEF